MKAVILAAGVASRLRPLTNDTPKCLLKIGDKSILERTIDNIVKNGINEIIVVTGYLRKMIEDFLLENYPKVNFKFIYNEIFDSTNNIYSLWMTKDEVIGSDMLLFDSDIIFDSRIVEKLVNSGYDNCLALRSDHILGDEEIKILTDENGSITDIGKQINPNNAIGESIGIEKFSRKFVETLFKILDRKIVIEKDVNIFYEAAFQDALDRGSKIYPVDVEELKCMEIDTFEDIDIAKEFVKGLA
jgi:choline kinase